MKPGDLITSVGLSNDSSQWPMWRKAEGLGGIAGWMTSKRIAIVVACHPYENANGQMWESILMLTSNGELGWNDAHKFRLVST
jgi:hypothetical protein